MRGKSKKFFLIMAMALTIFTTIFSAICSFASDTITMYTLDGRTENVNVKDIEIWKADGWYLPDDKANMYGRLNGKTAQVCMKDIAAWKEVGWDLSDATMYALDGRTALVNKKDVDAWKKVGWYSSYDTITMYALDGRSEEVYIKDFKAWKKVGWYLPDHTITMYALDGRTAQVCMKDVSAWENVGWYSSNVITMYAPDGRSERVNINDVNAWKKVGWYESEYDALISKYPRNNVKILKTYSDSSGAFSATWRNDSGKTIKYVFFNLTPYNRVGDPVYCNKTRRSNITVRTMGPFEPFNTSDARNSSFYFSFDQSHKFVEETESGKHYIESYDANQDTGKYYLKKEDYNFVFNEYDAWMNLWVNNTIEYVIVNSIHVDYMDGTSETIYNPLIWIDVFRGNLSVG